MNHDTARELLLDLAYGELAPAEARAVEAHLGGCESCRAERDRIAATRQLMQGLGEEPAPRGEGILLAAARQAVERPRRPPLFSWVRFATGLAVLMVVGGVTLELLSARKVDRAEEAYAERTAAAPPGLVLDAAPPASPRPVELRRAPAPPALAPTRPSPAPPKSARQGAAAEPPTAFAAPPPPRAEEEPRVRAPVLGAAADATAKSDDPPARELAAGKGASVGLAGEAKASGAVRSVAPAASPASPAPTPSPAVPAAPATPPSANRAEAADLARAPAARKVASAAPPVAATADREGPALVAEITRLRDEGLLNEARRRPEPCPGGDTGRMAWFDGLGVARRFARTGPLPAGMGAGEATRDQWYDGEGRLRYAVVEGSGPEGRFRRRLLLDADGAVRSEDPAGAAPWPRRDLTPRDPAAAFWAPQRCGPAAR